MSIDRDYSMYYHDTYVGYFKDGSMLPFYVEDVHFADHVFEDSDIDQDDESEWEGHTAYLYSKHEELKDALEFRGWYIKPDGTTHSVTLSMSRLTLDNPKLGYVKTPTGRWVWYTYHPNHSVKKGLCNRRLNIQRDLSREILYSLFNISPTEERISHDMILLSDGLHYKGVHVATREGDTLTLNDQLSIMEDSIKSLLPENICLQIG